MIEATALHYLVSLSLFLGQVQDLAWRAIVWPITNHEEALGAATGLLGAWMLGSRGTRAPLGWLAFLASNSALIAFALRHEHPGLLLLQLGFLITTARGIWTHLVEPRLQWGEWRGDLAGNVTMWIMELARWGARATVQLANMPKPITRGQWVLSVHKMVGTDREGCFHTHPARALRIVLWNGYVEEILEHEVTLPSGAQWWVYSKKAWRPGMIGIVRPELCHRIASLPRGNSYSLWLRWPKTHNIQLRGHGWEQP